MGQPGAGTGIAVAVGSAGQEAAARYSITGGGGTIVMGGIMVG